jgi:hypothetical protein
VVLHADELKAVVNQMQALLVSFMQYSYLRPPVLLSCELHHRELVRPHAAGADVIYFTHLDKVVEGLHCFFNRCDRVETVDLEEVEVVCAKTLEGSIASCVRRAVSAVRTRLRTDNKSQDWMIIEDMQCRQNIPLKIAPLDRPPRLT